MTSVKAFRVDRPANGGLGRGRFYFTDAYSVFDWGRMPDAIPGKGASLCAMGAATFEDLEAAGVPTHYRGVIPPGESTPPGGDGPAIDALSAHESGAVVPEADAAAGDDPGTEGEVPDPVALSAVEEPPVEMAIDLATVPELPHDGRTYDYEAYHAAAGSAALVPLEIVFRNVVPVGSSLRGRSTPADHGLDLAEWPDEAVALPEPVVEFSTKLEDGDRYLGRAEADRIAGPAALDELEAVARRVDEVVTERAAAAGFEHQDGKIECIVVDGEVRVADVAGTFDENRFAYDGVQVSKEVLRQYYRRTQPDWVDAVYAAKDAAREADDPDWKARCDRTPDPLPAEVVALASDLYCGGANAYLDRALFDAPPIADAVERVREL